MTPAEILSIAINIFVLGFAAWIIRSSHSMTQNELEKNRTEFKRLIDSLHKLELKLTNCVTWSDLDKVCSLEKCRIDDIDKRVDLHETRIAIMENKQ